MVVNHLYTVAGSDSKPFTHPASDLLYFVVPDASETSLSLVRERVKNCSGFARGRDQPFTLSHVVPAGECGCGRVRLVVSAE